MYRNARIAVKFSHLQLLVDFFSLLIRVHTDKYTRAFTIQHLLIHTIWIHIDYLPLTIVAYRYNEYHSPLTNTHTHTHCGYGAVSHSHSLSLLCVILLRSNRRHWFYQSPLVLNTNEF